MMRNMLIKDGEVLTIQNISLPIATYAKFQPVISEFLEFTDHRAVYVLEFTNRVVEHVLVNISPFSTTGWKEDCEGMLV